MIRFIKSRQHGSPRSTTPEPSALSPSPRLVVRGYTTARLLSSPVPVLANPLRSGEAQLSIERTIAAGETISVRCAATLPLPATHTGLFAARREPGVSCAGNNLCVTTSYTRRTSRIVAACRRLAPVVYTSVKERLVKLPAST